HWIVIIGFVVYFNALLGGFVWDDKTYIINNLDVHKVNLFGAFQENLFNNGGQYRPLPVLYFSVLYSLFNTSPFFYHFIQISLHIVNAILVFILFKKFFYNKLAFFLSLIFLVHPLQVESVSYIGATGNNLFFLFGISALLLTIQINNGKRKLLVLLFGLLLLSLLSKETGGLFLVMVLLYCCIYQRKKLSQYALYSLLTLTSYFSIRFFIGSVYFERRDLVEIARLGFFERLLNIPAVIFYYVQNFFYPQQLAIGQEWVITHITLQNFYLPLFFEMLFVLLMISFAIYLFKMNKKISYAFLFFILWLFSGFVLHSQIFPLDWTVSDRWFYFTIVGVLGVIGVFLQRFTTTNKARVILYFSIATVIISAFSVRTIIRNTNWSDAITLYTHDANITKSWDLENNLGFEYKSIDNQPEALKHYLKAVALFPFESTYLNAGIVYGNMGNQDKAIEFYYKALSAKHYPTSSHKHNLNTYISLINALLITHRTIEAKKVTELALHDYPNTPELWGELAIIQQWMNDDTNAVLSATKARNLQSTQFTNFIYDKILNKEKVKIYPGKNEVRFL
ncbi:MAG: tetratricopeptide repeat protein, partial [Candidatus Levyibacteriota bacterium]